MPYLINGCGNHYAKTTFSFWHGKRFYGSIGKKKKKVGQRISIV